MSDPWRRTRVGELEDPLLPRWFVLLAVVVILVAVGALAAAFVVFGPDEVPFAARRPPPADGLTTAVGAFNTGDLPPVPYENAACPTVEGIEVAGTDEDRKVLTAALDALCAVDLPGAVASRLRAFADAGGVVRFAQFEATGVDSTAQLDRDPPRILVNARFLRTEPIAVAPLLVHDTTYLEAEAGTVEGALTARRAEAVICARLFADARAPRGCGDAQALLALEDPAAALRAAGFE